MIKKFKRCRRMEINSLPTPISSTQFSSPEQQQLPLIDLSSFM